MYVCSCIKSRGFQMILEFFNLIYELSDFIVTF